MRFLLDTGSCIFIARRKPSAALTRLERLRPGDVGMSVVTYLELVSGALNSANAEMNLNRVVELGKIIPVLPLGPVSAENFGRLRVQLQREGSVIGAYNMIIAAHALSLHLTLVTNNVREFSRVPGLKIDNWLE